MGRRVNVSVSMATASVCKTLHRIIITEFSRKVSSWTAPELNSRSHQFSLDNGGRYFHTDWRRLTTGMKEGRSSGCSRTSPESHPNPFVRPLNAIFTGVNYYCTTTTITITYVAYLRGPQFCHIAEKSNNNIPV